MEILSLQESCFIKLAVMFFTKKGIEKHMFKQKNGTVQMEEGLKELKNSVFILELAINVKNRLINFIERVGYEIFVFVMRSNLNYPELQFNFAENIQWYPDGLINEKSTYAHYFEKNPNVFLHFECLSIICAEKELCEIWPQVCPETQRLKMNNFLVSYWVHNLQNNLNNFIGQYGHWIVGFDPDKSVHYNMILYCLYHSFKSALKYFFNQLSLLEKQLLAGEDQSPIQLSLFKKIVKNPKREHMRFICSFLEKPITDKSIFELITKHMPVDGIIELMTYLLRQVNFFGNLHYNLLRRIFGMSDVKIKKIVLSKLDFYVLSLMAKGHFETFEFSLKNSKDVLLQQISGRLKEGKGVALFYTICRNNHRHLLEKLIRYLSEDNEELLFDLKAALDES